MTFNYSPYISIDCPGLLAVVELLAGSGPLRARGRPIEDRMCANEQLVTNKTPNE